MRDITWGDISSYNEKEKYLDDLVNTNIRTQVLSLKNNDILIVYINLSGINTVGLKDVEKMQNCIRNINPDLLRRTLFIPVRSDSGIQSIEFNKMNIDNMIQHLMEIKNKLE